MGGGESKCNRITILLGGVRNKLLTVFFVIVITLMIALALTIVIMALIMLITASTPALMIVVVDCWN